MRPRLRRTRWRGAAALAGGLLLILAAGLPAARAQEPAPPLLFDDLDAPPEAGPQAQLPPGGRALPASFARHDGGRKQPLRPPKAKRQPLQGIQLARLEPPPAPPGLSLRGRKPQTPRTEETPYEAHAPPGDPGAETGKAAEARLLLLYTLLPDPAAERAPGPRLSIFADEIPSKADADETLWRMIAKTSPSGEGTSELRFFGENAQLLTLPASFSPGDAPVQANRQEFLYLSAEQRAGGGAYGAAYRYEGPDRRSARKYGKWVQSGVKWRRDQESLEAWHAQRLGDARLKFFVAEFWSNPDLDPRRYAIESTQAGLAANQRLGRTPLYLTLNTTQGASSSRREPRGAEPFSRAWDTYNAALSFYPDGRWDAYLSTGYSSAGDLSRTGDAGDLHWHEAGISIHPTWSTILKPVVALGKIRNERTGERIDYPFASLSLTFFDLLPRFEVTLWSSYARMTSKETPLDAAAAEASLRLARRLPLPGPARASLSLELGWSSYRDRLVPGRSSEGFSGMALLRFTY